MEFSARVLPPEVLAVGLAAAYAAVLGLGHVVPRYDAIVLAIVAWIAMRALAGVRGRRLYAALLAMGVVLAYGVLAHLWTTGHEGRAAVLAGIIPWSDAGQFTSDAERIVHGLPILESSRRPLFVALLAGVLRTTGNDLRVALAIFTGSFGIALGTMTWAAMRAHGRVAGFLVLVVGYFWVRRFTGFVGTEDASFLPGALGFALLVRSADLSIARPRRAALLLGGGVLATTLALAARPGPLLVVPALLAWALFAFRGRGRREALAAGVAGALVGVLIVKAVASRFATGATFNDYPNIVYALVHRGDLYSALNDHPELRALPAAERPGPILQILYADLRREPSLAVVGPLDAFVSFLFGAHGFFSFVWTNPDDHVLENGALVRRLVAEGGWLAPLGHWVRTLGAWSLLNAAVMAAGGGVFALASVAAAVRLVWRRHGRRHGLVLFVMVAVLASSIFAPTWIGEGMQMQTGVFGFVPYALVLGLARAPFQRRRDRADRRTDSGLLAATLGLPVAGAVIVLFVARAPLATEARTCSADTTTAAIVSGTRVLVRPLDAPPFVHNLEFLGIHNPELVRAVREAARPGEAMALLYDVCRMHTIVAFGPAEVLPAGDHSFRTLRFAPRPDEPQVVVVGLP